MMKRRAELLDPPLKEAADECGYRLGVALSIERPRMSAALNLSERALSRLTGRSEWRFVARSMGLFALWVADLPASERHHDRHPFGLVEHSVEVAAEVAQDLDRRWNAEGGGRILTAAERALWARVAVLTGLFHDAGKVLDVVVREPGSGAEWNPLREPLALFKRRWNLAFGTPSPFQYRAYRGLKGHEANTLAVARAMLSAAAWNGLGPFVLRALHAYTERHRAADPGLPVPFGYLAMRVHEADVDRSRLSQGRRLLSGGSPA